MDLRAVSETLWSRLARREMTSCSRRWEVSPEEQERIDAARRASFGAREAIVVLLRRPGLIGEVARTVIDTVRASIFANNSLASLLDAARARAVVSDAATGVGWYDERPFFDALMPYLSTDARVLELGCGAGRISRHVAPLVSELVCTDRSRMMVDEATENLASFANARAATTDGFSLSEFPDARFDAVFGQGVLGYVEPNQLLGLLDEVHRVLVCGGRCVFNFFTIDDASNARDQLVAVRRMARRRRFSGGLNYPYTRAYIEALYGVVGLEVVHAPGENGAVAGRSRQVVTALRPE